MPLDRRQQQIASQLIGVALSHGLSAQQAREFAAAAYAESGLRPQATNRRSGAAGLFQLLSSGYRNRAQQLGGLYDPLANALAILPSYQQYWKQHPRAAPGEAGAAVERSGQGAGFYASPLTLLSGVNATASPFDTGGVQEDQQVEVGGLPALRGMRPEVQQLALSRLSEHGPLARLKAQPQLLEVALSSLLPHKETIRQTLEQAGQEGALPAADSLGLVPGGGKPGQVEPALLNLAAKYGLKVTSGYRDVATQARLYANRSGPGTVAAPGKSYHNSGRAIDVDPNGTSDVIAYAQAHPSQFREFFYDPLGWYIKNGKVVKGSIGGHSDHIHIAV